MQKTKELIVFRKLQALYPYQFNGKNIGLSIANGWIDDFAKLCKDIDDLLGVNKRGFHWVQLKEKFGSARYYYEMKNRSNASTIDLIEQNESGVLKVSTFVAEPKSKDNEKELIEKIHNLIRKASDKTNSMCIVCSDLGSYDNQDGYTLVLCNKHKLERHAGKHLDIWPGED